MRIGIVGSMQFAKDMLNVRDQLIHMGHDAYVNDLVDPFVGKVDHEVEELKQQQKDNADVIKMFWEKMQGGDAILVMNFDKHDIPNYIGGNTLMEIGFAHVLGQKIYLWNPIPEIRNYKAEIEAVHPVILYQQLDSLRV